MIKVISPSVSYLRRSIPSESLRPSTLLGVFLFLVFSVLFAATFIGCLLHIPWLVRVFFSLTNALCIAILFILGHDACHDSLTSSTRLNRLLGRIAFLPSWHPFTSWEFGHNRLHHGWTNLRGKDYVWVPMSKEEFDQLPPGRRLLERFYRSFFGIGFYYLIQIWLRHMVFPSTSDRKKLPKTINSLDRATVILFAIAQVVFACAVSWAAPSSILGNLILAILIPQLLWTWLMGFIIFVQHTHPQVHWYDDPAEWTFYAGQVQGTVHVEFPWPIGPLLHNILEHTAHHIDPRIPLYKLPLAQDSIEQAYAKDVIKYRFSFSSFFGILSQCQLYDYSQHLWLTFEGTPISKSMKD